MVLLALLFDLWLKAINQIAMLQKKDFSGFYHVAELHLLVCGESAVVVAGDQRLELSRLQVWNLQNLVGVREAIIEL